MVPVHEDKGNIFSVSLFVPLTLFRAYVCLSLYCHGYFSHFQNQFP